MSDQLFGILVLIILGSLPVSLLIIFWVYRDSLKTTHYTTTHSPDLLEIYAKETK